MTTTTIISIISRYFSVASDFHILTMHQQTFISLY